MPCSTPRAGGSATCRSGRRICFPESLAEVALRCTAGCCRRRVTVETAAPCAPIPGGTVEPIRLAFAVRTYDIDYAGIVSNIVYIRWLEDLRLELLERAYPLDRLVAGGLGPVLLETRIAYRDA